MKYWLLKCLLGLVIVMSGLYCAGMLIRLKTDPFTKQKFMQIKIGMDGETVNRILGPPGSVLGDFSWLYSSQDSTDYSREDLSQACWLSDSSIIELWFDGKKTVVHKRYWEKTGLKPENFPSGMQKH
jgi:hypothetical protein